MNNNVIQCGIAFYLQCCAYEGQAARTWLAEFLSERLVVLKNIPAKIKNPKDQT